jgi:tetratricopeptide (TPR) repeat protein
LTAEVLIEERRGREALAAAEQAVQAAPRSSAAWNALARGRHALRDDEGALAAAREAERLLPEGDNFRQAAPVYLTLVWCLREMRLFQEALDAAEAGLLRVPDAVLAQWAGTVEDELAEAQRERC